MYPHAFHLQLTKSIAKETIPFLQCRLTFWNPWFLGTLAEIVGRRVNRNLGWSL